MHNLTPETQIYRETLELAKTLEIQHLDPLKTLYSHSYLSEVSPGASVENVHEAHQSYTSSACDQESYTEFYIQRMNDQPQATVDEVLRLYDNEDFHTKSCELKELDSIIKLDVADIAANGDVGRRHQFPLLKRYASKHLLHNMLRAL